MNYETMPFGKYKGVMIKDLPVNYITHCLSEFDLPDDLRMSMFDTLVSVLRFDDYVKSSNDYLDMKITLAYKNVSKVYHPDKGGSTQAMQAINEFKRLIYE